MNINYMFEDEIQHKALPQLFWIIDKGETNYFKAYRKINSAVGEDYPFHLVLIDNPKLKGKTIWVCLDISNGDIMNYKSKFYVWCFDTKKEAEEQFKLHKANKKFATLTEPIKCKIVDSF